MDKTITAISTPMGLGGIAVIRISGDDAVLIASRVFKGKSNLNTAKSHTIHYGYIVDKDGNNIDEVLVSIMLAPKTFTRENVVEISTHGGMTACKLVLDTLIHAGAYHAQAGEFTKRAFLNGRIDLSQAEAVIDIINSSNDKAQKNALSQLEGALSKKINDVRHSLVKLSASMQVIIDYPDEELEDVTTSDIKDSCEKALEQVQRLIATADDGKIIREGILTAIVGKPNVGKSSLLNALASEERAIVTDVAGTTRDVIEEYVSVRGVPLRLMDTAGIRDTEDIVEKIGVERSKKSIETADLILVMLDATKSLDEEDLALINDIKAKKHIILVNKMDSVNDDDKKIWLDGLHTQNIIFLSVKTGDGLDKLYEKIEEFYHLGEVGRENHAVITNMRHKNALIQAEQALGSVIASIDMGMPSDIASIDLNIAIDVLGEITGATVSEDIVSEIFHSFCVGK